MLFRSRRHARAPAVVFIAQHTFPRDLSWKGTIEPGSLERAMEVNHQVMLCGRGASLLESAGLEQSQHELPEQRPLLFSGTRID